MREGASRTIASALEDAELLLSYAARRGLLTADSSLKPIITARHALASASLTETDELGFWESLNKAADLVRPATIDGLRSMQPARPSGRGAGWLPWRSRSPADNAIRRYRLWAMLVLLVLAIMQIYYVVGAGALADITSIEAEGSSTTVSAGSGVPQGSARERQSIRLTTSYRTLKSWNEVWYELAVIVNVPGRAPSSHANATPKVVPAVGSITQVDGQLPANGDQLNGTGAIGVSLNMPELESLIEYTHAKFALTALQGYILPFLYGLLGTCVYILRNLSNEIRNSSYSSDVGYRLRMPLGALAGVAIAWVVVPESQPGLVRSLPPLGLAFLAGYSVEVLFAAMDRFIAAFSNDAPVAPR